MSSNLATASQKPLLLIGSDYFPAVHKALSQAQQSIDIVMYFMIMDPESYTNSVNILINDLIEARKKDARVKVILENERFKENQLAFETLRRNGIDVYYDTPKTCLHSKAIVIDSRICIFGSINWSKTAFYNLDAEQKQNMQENAFYLEKNLLYHF
jgi:phosphatidylserine/phosphatidylglycerophosphate/cardiolipin synthase-like enzyme